MIAPPISPASSGASGPRLSENLPASGLTIASRPAASSQVAPIATAERAELVELAAGRARDIVPNSRPGTVTSARPVRTSRLHSEPIRPLSEPSPSGLAAGMRSVHMISSTPIAPTVQNTTSKPTMSAVTPITGPNSAPAIAAPMTEPIICPRFSRGAAPATQAITAAQPAALPKPWTKRAMSSTTMRPAKAMTTLVSDISVSPKITVGFTPMRAAIQPPGRPPANVPSGYAAASRPAPVFDRPNCSVRSGSSGVIAA